MRSALLLLLRLFPEPFRERFGDDMEDQIRRDWARARSRSRVHALGFTLLTALDLVRSGLAERLDPVRIEATENEREGRTRTMTIDWTKDLTHALRGLRRSPGFAVLSIGTLGVALGAAAGIFTMVEAVLLEPLPFASADRLVHIEASAPGSDFPSEFGVSSEFYLQYREESELLEELTTYNAFTATLRVDDRVERAWMSAPTTSFFETLEATPVLGRLPEPEDESDVVVISHGLWDTWFGRDPEVLGRSYHVAGAQRTVIGVMGPDFWFPDERVLLWIPTVIRAEGVRLGRFSHRLVGRVAPGVTHEALTEELGRLAGRLPDRFGGTPAYAELIARHRPVVRSLEEELLGSVSGPLWVLLGSTGLVLLIACANVANLFIVRAERRQRDEAVRRAMGADRARLIRARLSEALVVAGGAGVLAVLLARLGVPAFVAAAPRDIPRLAEVAVTPTTLVFTLGACIVSALLCGLFPAIRWSAPDLQRLRDGSRGSTRRRPWARDGLVAGQTALALVLLIGSGLLVRSFQELNRVDPGYDVTDVFTFQIAPEGDALVDGPSFAAFHTDFMARVAGLPGVESVGLVENVPLNEGLSNTRFVAGGGASDPEAGALLDFTWAGGDYFRTMDIEVLEGRPLRPADHGAEPGNVVVSRAAAELLWPGESPVGRRLRRADGDSWWTVVGVVEDVMQYGFRGEVQPLVYFPLVGFTPDEFVIASPAYVVRTPRADEIAPEIRALVRDAAPTAPMYRAFTMEGLAADSMVDLSFTMLTLGLASALALMLGTVGLFGVLSYVVAQRTREIGVRMALGAEAPRVRRMVVAQGARVVAVGVAVGLAVAVAVTRVLDSLLFGVAAMDPGTFAGMAAAMVLTGLLASYVPAWRASTVDPVDSLRGE